MILVVNICKEKLHYFEFVKPIEDILKTNNIKYFTCNYKDIKDKELKKADKIIICGTSLYDNEFINNIDKFKWILDFSKPILGICGGMQIIGLVYNGCLLTESEVGFYSENIRKEFLGLFGKCEVYHLHNNFVDFTILKEFEVFSTNGKISQAIKHKEKEIYGTLFHPEVRNKEMIVNFAG
jgi:anthranilate/para-aminobenzoate synthase component II